MRVKDGKAKEQDPLTYVEPSRALPASHLKAITKGRLFTFHDFDLRNTVGIGTFGRVRVVRFKNSKEKASMALKILKKCDVIRMKQVQHVLAEKLVMSMLEHPFVVNILSTFQDDKRLFMLMEFVNGGELFSHLRREGRLPNDHARFYAGEITLALAYLHQLGVVYRDLKPENILIDCEGHVKMTDFGFAKVIQDVTFTLCGTPEYLAPEIIQSTGHGKGVDWWALGVLTFEMLAGFPPFFEATPFGIYQKVLSGKVEFPRHFDIKAKDLIKRLLVQDKTKRLGCLKHGSEDVQHHKWYKGLDWDDLLNRSVRPPYLPAVKGHDDTSMYDRYPESTEASAPAIGHKDNEAFELFSGEATG